MGDPAIKETRPVLYLQRMRVADRDETDLRNNLGQGQFEPATIRQTKRILCCCTDYKRNDGSWTKSRDNPAKWRPMGGDSGE